LTLIKLSVNSFVFYLLCLELLNFLILINLRLRLSRCSRVLSKYSNRSLFKFAELRRVEPILMSFLSWFCKSSPVAFSKLCFRASIYLKTFLFENQNRLSNFLYYTLNVTVSIQNSCFIFICASRAASEATSSVRSRALNATI
jgi:hypothetical protein